MPRDDGHLWFDLNLAVLEDEPLVVLAQECQYGPARDELILRFQDQADRLIRWLAPPQGVGQADIDDARQSAVFSIVEAINKYDTGQIGRPNGCSFRSFIYRVLIARFKDFAKHLRRVERHYDRTAHYSDDDLPSHAGGTLEDPATIAEVHESMSRLQSTLAYMDSDSERLWKLLADGKCLREIASRLGVSYDTAKRRRRKLIAELKLRLSSPPESVAFSGDAKTD